MPPHRHVFTGGSDSVRGFRDGTLGPRDSLGNPYGGDAGVSAQFEAIVPLPAKFQTSARLSLFYDVGQSFYLGDTGFRNRRGDRTDYHFDLGELRLVEHRGEDVAAPAAADEDLAAAVARALEQGDLRSPARGPDRRHASCRSCSWWSASAW